VQCPAKGGSFIDCVDSLAPLRSVLTPYFSAAFFPIQTNSIPRSPRDFYFRFRVIKPVSRLLRTGLALLSRSFP
jgi:hypothetical protein